MITIDTDIWLALARREPLAKPIVKLLREGIAEVHPLVFAELELGFSARALGTTLRNLEALIGPPARSHHQVMTFARENGIRGAGIAYLDAHLLASAYLDGRLLWSAESDVQRIADRLGVGFRPGAG